MERHVIGTVAGGGLLLAIIALQGIRIAGLEGRLAVLEAASLDAAQAQAGRSPLGPKGWKARMRNGDDGSAGTATVRSSPGTVPDQDVRAITPEIVETVKDQLREEEMERRERGREMWVASIREEIEDFGAEENLTDEQIQKAQAYAEDYLLTISDFRRSIWEGEISPEAGRDEMKAFGEEHEQRMNDLLGEETYGRLQPRIGRGRGGRR